jgi:hypothetical protein
LLNDPTTATAVTTTNSGAVEGSLSATASCGFVGNALAIGTPVARRIGTTQAQIATATGGKAGVLTSFGYTDVSIAPTVTLSNFAAFGSGTMTGMISFNQAQADVAPTGTNKSVNSGATHKVALAGAVTDVHVPLVAVHSTTGFKTVGAAPVTLAITCAN